MIRLIYISLLTVVFLSCKRERSQNRTAQSSSNRIVSSLEIKEIPQSNKRYKQRNGVTTVKMIKKGGVYEIPVKINGIQMDMIFDTGASSISISELEALFLIKQGAISEDDILGTQEFQTATGQISEGTVINIKSIQIGDRIIYDVKANVVHNLEAPLLLGQSALSRLGKVTINYEKNEIIFD